MVLVYWLFGLLIGCYVGCYFRYYGCGSCFTCGLFDETIWLLVLPMLAVCVRSVWGGLLVLCFGW